MKKLLLLAAVLLIASPSYGQVNLGTSSSATNPQVTGDATTGLFSSTSDAVSVSSGGTEIMRVNGTGVGIGITSPSAGLDVVNSSGVVSRRNTGTVGGTINIGSGSYQWKLIGNEIAGGDLMFNNPAGGTVIYMSQTGGTVGIGTTSPAYTLDVRGTAGSTLASNNLPVINKITRPLA